MALKFQCKSCGKDIAVKFLQIGEAAECKSCGASNPVPESAEEISNEAAEGIIKAPVSGSVEDISPEAIGAEPAQNVPMAKALRRVSRMVIGIGIIVGIAGAIKVMIQHPAPDQTMAVALSGGMTWLMNMFFFCILNVLCLGIAKVVVLFNR